MFFGAAFSFSTEIAFAVSQIFGLVEQILELLAGKVSLWIYRFFGF